MRKRILSLSILLVGSIATLACDMCNMYLSMQPNDFNHSIQLNYRFRSESSLFTRGYYSATTSSKRHSGLGRFYFEDTQVKEEFHTWDLWGRYFVNPKWLLAVNVPLTNNRLLHNNKIEQETQGIGDVMITSFHYLYNSMADSNNFSRHRIILGGGIKLPTGAYKKRKDDELIDLDLQSGTGSLDFVGIASYVARVGKWGVNGRISYKFNTKNNLGYTYANSMNAELSFFRIIYLKKWNVVPAVGYYYEQAESDVLKESVVDHTGGQVSFLNTGFSFTIFPVTLDIKYQVPVKEDLIGKQLSNNDRLILGLTYNINSAF